jgi:hypothetical protein
MDDTMNIMTATPHRNGEGRVLVACEYSGTVRDAFAARGWDAWSCDILPSETPGNHHQCDVREVLTEKWDVMIAHPPLLTRWQTNGRSPRAQHNVPRGTFQDSK